MKRTTMVAASCIAAVAIIAFGSLEASAQGNSQPKADQPSDQQNSPPPGTGLQRIAHEETQRAARIAVAYGRGATDALCRKESKATQKLRADEAKRADKALNTAVDNEARNSPEMRKLQAELNAATAAAKGQPANSDAGKNDSDALGKYLRELQAKKDSIKKDAIAEAEAYLDNGCQPPRTAEQPPAKPQQPAAPGGAAQPAPAKLVIPPDRCRTPNDDIQLAMDNDELDRMARDYLKLSAAGDQEGMKKNADESAIIRVRKMSLEFLKPCPEQPTRAAVPPANEHGLAPRNCPSDGLFASNCVGPQDAAGPGFFLGPDGEPQVDRPQRDGASPPIDAPGVPGPGTPYGGAALPGGVGANGRP